MAVLLFDLFKQKQITPRVWHILSYARILTLEEVADLTESELLLLNNFGENSLSDIKEMLAKHGLELKNEFVNTPKSELLKADQMIQEARKLEAKAKELRKQAANLRKQQPTPPHPRLSSSSPQ